MKLQTQELDLRPPTDLPSCSKGGYPPRRAFTLIEPLVVIASDYDYEDHDENDPSQHFPNTR